MYKYLIILAVTVAAELLYFRLARRYGIVDRPNARSSHRGEVIRGGGIVFTVATLAWFAAFGWQQPLFILGLVLVTGVSLWDDIRSLPNSVRLLVQFVAMLLMLADWQLLEWSLWWAVLRGLVLCVGIINAYNFMDGINGITSGYSLAVLLPLLWLDHHRFAFMADSLLWVAILACLVFCFFNFRTRARCFAGDVGSVSLAFIVVYLVGRFILYTSDMSWIVMLSVYGVDTVLTIVHRIMLREPLGQAHRKHAYQLMANELKIPHVRVASFYMGLQLLITVGMILLPNALSWHYGYLLAVCLLLSAAYVLFMRKYYHLHEEYLRGAGIR